MSIRATALLLLVGVAGSPRSTSAADGPGSCFLGAGECAVPGLRTPTSPAFVLIGVSPTQVERPTTPQDVAATFFDIPSRADGLPRDLALEIAPYWLVSHPKLTYARYTHPRLHNQLLYNATVSIATAPVEGSDSAADLGVGVRTHVFIDLASPQQVRAVHDAEAFLAHGQELRNLANAYQRAGCPRSAEVSCPGLEAQIRDLGVDEVDPEAILAQTESPQLARHAKTLQEALAARDGVVISLAGAVAGRTPAGKRLSWRQPTKGAGWINAGYERPSATALAVARYTQVNQGGSLQLLDAGGRVIWIAPRFSLSAEYLRRFVLARPSGTTFEDSERATVTVEIPLTGGVWVSATAGQDAATESRPSGLITLLGVTLQASRDRHIAVAD